MKKVLKALLILIVIGLLVAGITFLIDASRVASEKEPLCSIKTKQYQDGGTTEYLGVGYKIIDFHMLNGYDEAKIGSWFMKYEDFKDEYEVEIPTTPKDNEEDNTSSIPSGENVESGETVEVSGEALPSGEEITSGDEKEPSGEVIEPSGEASLSGEEVVEEKTESGETKPTSGETEASIPNTEEENKPVAKSFKGTITGIRGNSMIVTADEGEEIRKSSDLLTFAIPNEGVEYTVGQKVQIEYTGEILEVYPAQITVTKLEVIE